MPMTSLPPSRLLRPPSLQPLRQPSLLQQKRKPNRLQQMAVKAVTTA